MGRGVYWTSQEWGGGRLEDQPRVGREGLLDKPRVGRGGGGYWTSQEWGGGYWTSQEGGILDQPGGWGGRVGKEQREVVGYLITGRGLGTELNFFGTMLMHPEPCTV